jgi:hypothetical protein
MEGYLFCRLVDVVNSKIYSVYPEEAQVDTLPQKVLRLEEVLPEEVNLSDNELLVPAAHFQKVLQCTVVI